jgi:hypothetical protein
MAECICQWPITYLSGLSSSQNVSTAPLISTVAVVLSLSARCGAKGQPHLIFAELIGQLHLLTHFLTHLLETLSSNSYEDKTGGQDKIRASGWMTRSLSSPVQWRPVTPSEVQWGPGQRQGPKEVKSITMCMVTDIPATLSLIHTLVPWWPWCTLTHLLTYSFTHPSFSLIYYFAGQVGRWVREGR